MNKSQLISKFQTLALLTVLSLLVTACPSDDETSPLAKIPGISISANPSPLTEASLDGATLTLTLANATYSDSIEASQFTLTTAPAITGLTVSGVSRSDANNAVVTLAYTGTDFDTDATLSVTVAAAAHDGAEALTTATVTITAVVEPAVSIATTPATLSEANLNGATLTLTLMNATYTDPLTDASLFTLTIAPAITGLTISGVSRSDANNAVVTLAYTGTDFDTDSTLSVTVAASAHTGAEDLTTATVTITANADPMAVGTLSARSIAQGGTVDVDVSSAFMDPGDTLTYTAVSADITTATVAVSASTVTITGAGLGDTTITVTATDTQSQTAVQTIAVIVRVPMASLGAPAADTITEGGTDSDGMTATGSATVTVELDTPAPSTGLSVLIDITQMTPATTPVPVAGALLGFGVTYAVDYGVAVADPQAGFSFDETETNTLKVRRVVVPFAAGDRTRTLTLTASEDVDGLSEVLSIALVGGTGYTVTGTASDAMRTLTMTDNEPVLMAKFRLLLSPATISSLGEEEGGGVFQITIPSPAESEIMIVATISGAGSNPVVDADIDSPFGFFAIILSTGFTISNGAFLLANNSDMEEDKTLRMTLHPGNGYRLPAQLTYDLIIIDDD